LESAGILANLKRQLEQRDYNTDGSDEFSDVAEIFKGHTKIAAA
jgi:hypothetical protein